MSDTVIPPVVQAHTRRKRVGAATVPIAGATSVSLSPSAVWERLATHTGLALLAFDQGNALRLLSPAAAHVLGIPVADVLDRSLRLALAHVTLVGVPEGDLAEVVEFPRGLADGGQAIGTIVTSLGEHRVHAFPVEFESDGARGRALLFEPIVPSRASLLDATLRSTLQDGLREVADAADTLRQKTRRADVDTQRALAQTIYTNASRLSHIVTDAGALQEATASGAAFRPEPMELSDLMMELMAEWQQVAPSYFFELALPGELPLVTADPERVRQALSSLLRFAVTVSAPGDTLRLAVRHHDDHLMVSMRTHQGQFARGSLDALLQPFARVALGVDSDTARTLGLELQLTQALVALHGGSIRIESAAPESGLIAHVTLPLLPTVTRRAAPSASALPAPSEPVAPPISARREICVLIAARDQRLARYVRANLEVEGFHCNLAADAQEAERRIELDDPDLVLLDVALAETHPDAMLRHLRAISASQFLMLAPRHNPSECARLLDLGAADYLVVPLSLDELLARIRVILRARDRTLRSAQPSRVFRSGGLVIDFDRRSVTVDERQVALSKTEFKLLRALAEHAGMVLSHEMLLARVWGPGYGQEVEFAWVYVRRLRKKIEADPGRPRYILTVPGVGYKLAML